MSDVQREVYVEGLGQVFYRDYSDFDDATKALSDVSDGLITLRELAYSRIHENKDSSVSEKGSYVQEGSLFVPNSDKKRIWLRNSLVLENPSLAVKAHKKNKEYSLEHLLFDYGVNRYLEKLGKNDYFIVKDTTSVPTNRFGEDERMVWAFQDQAKEYGAFLNGAGIKKLDIEMNNRHENRIHYYNDYVDCQFAPFANQLYLHGMGVGIDGFSWIGGESLGLNGGIRVRGVRRDKSL